MPVRQAIRLVRPHRLEWSHPKTPQAILVRSLSCSSTQRKKSDQLPPRPTLPDSELHHVYLKGSGPGGQKINKTNSAVQLTHLPTGIVVKSQATRSRSQNHNIARRILAEKIEVLEKGDESRAAKKVERARKKKASAAKKSRRKYRKLLAGEDEGEGGENGKGVESGGEAEIEEEDDDDNTVTTKTTTSLNVVDGMVSADKELKIG